MRSRREWVIIGVMASIAMLLPVWASATDQPFIISLASRILIYALAAASLDLILGYGAMVSFGHAAFVGIGAYTVAVLAFHADEGSNLISWPFTVPGSDVALVTWPAAILTAAVFGLIIGAASLRTTGIFFIMITLAFAQMLYFVFVSLEAYGGDDGLSLYARNTLPGIDLSNASQFYYVCLGVLSVFLLFASRLVNSRFGQVLQGCKQNEPRMRALGYATYRYKLAAFTIASAAAGMAGALLANHTEFVSPGVLHWTRSGDILIMVILGGMGTLFGPVLGAIALLGVEELLSDYTEHWAVILGPLLILTVLFARHGLYGLLAGTRGSDD